MPCDLWLHGYMYGRCMEVKQHNNTPFSYIYHIQQEAQSCIDSTYIFLWTTVVNKLQCLVDDYTNYSIALIVRLIVHNGISI